MIFVLFAVSCKDNRIDELSQSVAPDKQEIVFSDGLLRFSSKEVFGSTLGKLNTKEEISRWQGRFNGFKSLRSHYEELVAGDICVAIKEGTLEKYKYAFSVHKDENGIDSYDCSVTDTPLASVLNKDGLVQIGDYVYRVTDERMLRVKFDKKSDLFHTVLPNTVESQIVEHKPIQLKNLKNGRMSLDVYPDPVTYTPFPGASERRFVPNYWAINYCWLGYASTGLEVKHQRRNWWGWGQFDAGYWFGIAEGNLEGQSINYNTTVIPADNSLKLRWKRPSGTCSSNPPVSIVFTTLRIDVTGNDGLRRSFSYPFSASM